MLVAVFISVIGELVGPVRLVLSLPQFLLLFLGLSLVGLTLLAAVALGE